MFIELFFFLFIFELIGVFYFRDKKHKKGKEKDKSFEKERDDDIIDESKKKKQDIEQQNKKLENAIEEAGLPMAFNVIFSGNICLDIKIFSAILEKKSFFY